MNNWKRSSRCDIGDCVEIQIDKEFGEVQVRDSKNPKVFMAFSTEEWQAFIAGAKDGEFDV